MKTFKTLLIFGFSFFVLSLCFWQLKKDMNLEPKIEVIAPKDWSLTTDQIKKLQALNESFASSLSLKNFVSEFTSVFRALSSLPFVEDARWAWDHQQPFKIKAYVSSPKAMMYKKNQWYLISEKGNILRKVATDQTLDLPIFTSESLLKNNSLREECFRILSAFDSSDSTVPLKAVSEISSDKRGISFVLSEGYKVYMSDKNTVVQIKRVSNVIAYLKREKINVEFIDSQTPQKILVRPRLRKD